MNFKSLFARASRSDATPSKLDEMWSAWFEGKDFTQRMFTREILRNWLTITTPMQDQEVEILEIGSFEGQSAISLLELLPRSRITCIDGFRRSDVEQRFDSNLALYAHRLTKLKGLAAVRLGQIMFKKMGSFSFIYHDCGKSREGTFAQSALAWPLLRVGGIFVWDDLTWRPHRQPQGRPEPAIRLFHATFRDCMTVLHEGDQLIVRKTRDWPAC